MCVCVCWGFRKASQICYFRFKVQHKLSCSHCLINTKRKSQVTQCRRSKGSTGDVVPVCMWPVEPLFKFIHMHRDRDLPCLLNTHFGIRGLDFSKMKDGWSLRVRQQKTPVWSFALALLLELTSCWQGRLDSGPCSASYTQPLAEKNPSPGLELGCCCPEILSNSTFEMKSYKWHPIGQWWIFRSRENTHNVSCLPVAQFPQSSCDNPWPVSHGILQTPEHRRK